MKRSWKHRTEPGQVRLPPFWNSEDCMVMLFEVPEWLNLCQVNVLLSENGFMSIGVYLGILTRPSAPSAENEQGLLFPPIIKTIWRKGNFSPENTWNEQLSPTTPWGTSVYKQNASVGGNGWWSFNWLHVQKLPFTWDTVASNQGLFQLPALLTDRAIRNPHKT